MTRHARTRRAGRGFTMIEIMIVVGIIIILAAIGLAVGMQVKRSSADQATKTTLSALDQAMALYLKDHKEPADANWFQMLQLFPPTNAILQKLKYHYTTPTGGGAPVPDGIMDAYGTPIHYQPATATKPNGFFVSYGPDGIDNGTAGGGDDIYSEGTTAQ